MAGFTARSRALADETLNPQAVVLWRAGRDKGCTRCELSQHARSVCVFGDGPVPAVAAIVGEAPSELDDILGRPNRRDTADFPELEFDGAVAAGRYLDSVLVSLDIDPAAVYRTYAVRCASPAGARRKKLLETAGKACAPYLAAELLAVRPRAVLAMGATAYYHFVHREGVSANRGKAFAYSADGYETTVVPTLHPLAVLLNPKHHAVFTADVAKWWRIANERNQAPRVTIVRVRSHEALATALDALGGPGAEGLLTFDLETRGFHSERAGYSRVWGAALTSGKRDADGGIVVYEVPLEHPDAPWYGDADALGRVVRTLCGFIEARPRVSGHSVKYDVRHLRRLTERHGVG